MLVTLISYTTDDHNMELDEQSKEELLNSELLPEQTSWQYHKQCAKQFPDLHKTITGSLIHVDLQCQNEQTGRSKSLMILMQEI